MILLEENEEVGNDMIWRYVINWVKCDLVDFGMCIAWEKSGFSPRIWCATWWQECTARREAVQ